MLQSLPPLPRTTWTLAPSTTFGHPTIVGTCSNLFSCDPTPLSMWIDRQTWLKNYLPVNYVHPCIRGQNLVCELKNLTPGQFDTRDTLLLYSEYPRVISFMVCSLPDTENDKDGLYMPILSVSVSVSISVHHCWISKRFQKRVKQETLHGNGFQSLKS